MIVEAEMSLAVAEKSNINTLCPVFLSWYMFVFIFIPGMCFYVILTLSISSYLE